MIRVFCWRRCYLESQSGSGAPPIAAGCPFLNLMTEFPDQDHPGRVVARGNKEEMRGRLATIIAKLGAADPNRVASQLALIINGAYVTGLIEQPTDLRGDLVDAAMKLLARNGQAKPFSKSRQSKDRRK